MCLLLPSASSKLCLVLLCLCVFGFTASAQIPTEKTILWKLESGKKTKNKNVSYLFGTIHMICPDLLNLDGEVEKRLSATKRLFFESKPGAKALAGRINDTAGITKLTDSTDRFSNMKMPDGKSFKIYISKFDYDSCSHIFKDELHISFSKATYYQPRFVKKMVLYKVLNCRPLSVEEGLANIAHSYPIEIDGLETQQDVDSIERDINYKAEVNSLVTMILNYKIIKTEYDKIANLYANKDLTLLTAPKSETAEYKERRKKIVDKRNESWLPKIEAAMSAEPVFIAVGAGHLGGEMGLIKKLRDKGYKVTPVMY